MKTKRQSTNGIYIWCYVNEDSISPEGNGKSLDYALTIKHHQKENWKLYRLILVEEV